MKKLYEFYHGKNYSPFVIGLSAASTWTWAPALILSTDIAANKGVIGVLSFIIPNILALWLFAFIGKRLSPISLWQHHFIRGLYHAGYGTVEFFCVLIQVTAGANILSRVFGVPYLIAVLLFLGCALIISWMKGLHGTIISNVYEQLLLIILGIILVISVIQSYGGKNPIPLGLFSFKDSLIYTLILFSGPIMTNQHWQRAQRQGYLWAGFLFGIPLCCLSYIGLLSGITGEYISFSLFTSPTQLGILVLIVLSGLASTLQSSFTSIIGIFGGTETYYNARLKMTLLATSALIIILCNIQLLTLWTAMGTFRVVMAGGVLLRLYVFPRRKACI